MNKYSGWTLEREVLLDSYYVQYCYGFVQLGWQENATDIDRHILGSSVSVNSDCPILNLCWLHFHVVHDG